MSLIFEDTPAIRLFDSDYNYLPDDTAIELAQALRAGDIVLSTETQIQSTGVYLLHKISFAGRNYHIGVPIVFDATQQYTFDYITDNRRLVNVMLA